MHRPESRASVQTSKREKYSLMARIDSHEIRFQCPKCGHDLKQTIGRLKANERMTCPGCGVGINIDSDRLAKATEEIEKAQENSAGNHHQVFSLGSGRDAGGEARMSGENQLGIRPKPYLRGLIDEYATTSGLLCCGGMKWRRCAPSAPRRAATNDAPGLVTAPSRRREWPKRVR
jgi:predicted RNA-binding Zn-ribbon protein involved in translation (DUF1610 family)